MIKSANKINIRDVARKSGVSIATVSKAINNKPDISEERRVKIIEVCESLGYTVNTSIQDMVRIGRSSTTRNIAFILVNRKFSQPYYSTVLDGIAKAADENGLHLILETLTGTEKSRYELPPMLRDCRVDGIIITGDLNADIVSVIKKTAVPYVILGIYDNAVTAGAVNVLPDIRDGISLLIKTLRNKGKRRIAYFTESTESFSQKASVNLYKSALLENNMEIDESLIYTGTGPYSGACDVMKEVFRRKTLPFDSILCIDIRTAHEIECLSMAHYGFNRKPDIILGFMRPADDFRFMIPVVFFESLMDKVAYEGMNALMALIKNKGQSEGKKIVINNVTMEEKL